MKRILLLFFYITIGFFSFASDFNEIPVQPGTYDSVITWLYFANDGLGHNFGTDEDNLRSWGFTSGVYLFNRLLINLDFESFNDRNTDYDLSKRIDEIKGLIGYNLLPIQTEGFSLLFLPGIGGILYDNLNTYDVQNSAHGINNPDTRPTPEEYDISTFNFFGFLYSEFFLKKYSLNLSFFSYLNDKLDFSIETTAGYWISKELLQTKFSVSYQYNKAENYGTTANNIYAAENEIWLSSKVMLGPFVLERGVNLNNLNQAGNAGLKFNSYVKEKAGGDFRYTYSFGWPIGHNSNIETFSIHPIPDFSQVGFYLQLYQTEDTYMPLVRRIKKAITAGAEMYLNNPDTWNLFNCFIYLGLGYNREVHQTDTQLAAEMLEEAIYPVAHAGIAVRLEMPDLIFGRMDRYTGAQLKADIYYTYEPATLFENPYFLLSWQMFFSER